MCAWLAKNLGRLLPPSCAVCGRGLDPELPGVCGPCWHRLQPIPPPHCARCGATSPRTRDEQECGECEGWPLGLRAAAPYRMQGGAARLVRALKYDGWRVLAEPMGGALIPAAKRLAEETRPLLVPVPLAPARMRERGFNQAELLARTLGDKLNWPVADLLVRSRSGRRQAKLGRSSRLQNVRDMFGLRPGGVYRGGVLPEPGAADRGGSGRALGIHRSLLHSSVLLVDDVVTTGATGAACFQVVHEAGLRCAGVVSFARAVHPLGGE